MSASVNIEDILNMQRKLYSWSRSDSLKVFSDLFNLVCDRRTLALAWKQLSRNQGSRTPGIDGWNRRKIEKRSGGVERFLEEIREELRAGTYRPQPVKQRLIPKPGRPGRFRSLGIPTLKDRLVQMALKIVLEPIFEADFYPTSYGFRRGRSTLDALSMIVRRLHPTPSGESSVRYVIEGDIKGCFDSIDHHGLMERIRRRIKDRKVLRLIRSFLKAGIMAEGNVRHPVAGTPQGGIISPLLSNIYLTALDERYRRWTPPPGESNQNACQRRIRDRKKGKPTFFIVRYADDFVILVSGEKDDAEAEKERLAGFLREQLLMELSMEKTFVTDVKKGFEFLGYRVVQERAWQTNRLVGKLYIPKGKLQLLRNRLKKLISLSTTGRPLAALLGVVNPIIVGWRNYYRYATYATKEFNKLDWWMWHRIFRWLRKKHPKATARALGRRFNQRIRPTRTIWGEGKVTLRLFVQGGSVRYRFRGDKISNGWNDELDGVSFYREVARPISGFTMLGIKI